MEIRIHLYLHLHLQLSSLLDAIIVIHMVHSPMDMMIAVVILLRGIIMITAIPIALLLVLPYLLWMRRSSRR
jgi:hypothetical protein